MPFEHTFHFYLYIHHFEVNETSLNSESGFMLGIQHVASNITTTDQKSPCLCQLKFIALNVQAFNKLKMGTSLCDVTVMFKRQEKNENIFFLNKIHFQQENVCLTLFNKASNICKAANEKQCKVATIMVV